MDNEMLWDRRLKISTAGRDDSFEDAYHFPYEPTPYSVLERLAGSGWIGADNCLVDYGCGKGRVCFFMTEETGCRSIGIDFLPGFIETAEENRNNAAGRNRNNAAGRNRKNAAGRDRISFFQADAAAYEVPAEADRFFFFNPFSEVTLQAVLQNILDSWYIAPRRILLFFYYPSDAYIANLMNMDELEFLDEIDCSELFPGDARERILCFEILEDGEDVPA